MRTSTFKSAIKWNVSQPTLDFFTTLFFCFVTFHLFVGAAVVLPFAQNDDYNYFRYVDRSTFAAHPQYEFFRWTGRHGYNAIGFFLGKSIHTVSDIVFVRLTVELIHALWATILISYIRTFRVSPVTAFLIIMPIILLPGFTASILWVTLTPYAVAALLGVLGGRILLFVDFQSLLNIRNQKRSTLFSQSVLFSLSFCTLMAAMYIFPTWAFFFLFPAMCQLLFDSKGCVVKRVYDLAGCIALCLSASALFFVFHKFVYLPFYFSQNPHLLPAYNELSIHGFNITTDLVSRILEMIRVAFPIALNLWILEDGSSFWKMFLTVVFAGTAIQLAIFFVGHLKKGSLWQLIPIFLAVALILIAILLSLSPIMLADGSHFGYRLLVLFSAISYLIFSWIIVRLAKSLSVLHFTTQYPQLLRFLPQSIFAVSLLCAGISANTYTSQSALNSSRELYIVRSEIYKWVSEHGQLEHVHIITPPASTSYLGVPIKGNGEFFFNSAWAGAPWLVSAALLDLRGPEISVVEKGKAERLTSVPGKVVVSKSLPDETFEKHRGSLVIDLSKYIEPSKKPLDFILGSMTIGSAQTNKRHDVFRAFDNDTSADSFWEIPFDSEVEVNFKFPKERIIRKIDFSAGEIAENMPSTVMLYGRKSEFNWQLLSQTVFDKFKNFETKTFVTNNLKAFSEYRLLFTNDNARPALRIYEIKFE